MNYIVTIVFLLYSTVLCAGEPDLSEKEVRLKLKEMYPNKHKSMNGSYNQKEDQWEFYYTTPQVCIDCDFYVVIKDSKENPRVIVVPHG